MSRMSNFVFTQPGPIRLYSTTELLTLSPPEWLVDRIIPEGGLVGLYGMPESGKSFIAIDLALCVATGLSWHGHAVQQGYSLYVAAEGGPGISKRVRAWLKATGTQATEAHVAWLIESLSIHTESDDIEILMRRLDDEVQCAPKLIVVDTLARCFDGDENQQQDMGRFVAGLDKLRHTYGSTLVAVHHTRLDGDRERGNTAFRGGTDTMIMVERDEHGSITLSCTKQKDAEHFEPMDFQLKPIPDSDSCIVVDEGLERENIVLNALKRAGRPLRAKELEALVTVTGMSPKTMYRALVTVTQQGQILKEKGMYRLVTVTKQ